MMWLFIWAAQFYTRGEFLREKLSSGNFVGEIFKGAILSGNFSRRKFSTPGYPTCGIFYTIPVFWNLGWIFKDSFLSSILFVLLSIWAARFYMEGGLSRRNFVGRSFSARDRNKMALVNHIYIFISSLTVLTLVKLEKIISTLYFCQSWNFLLLA